MRSPEAQVGYLSHFGTRLTKFSQHLIARASILQTYRIARGDFLLLPFSVHLTVISPKMWIPHFLFQVTDSSPKMLMSSRNVPPNLHVQTQHPILKKATKIKILPGCSSRISIVGSGDAGCVPILTLQCRKDQGHHFCARLLLWFLPRAEITHQTLF